MYAIYDNIYHQYTANVSIYTSTMDPSWDMGWKKKRWKWPRNTEDSEVIRHQVAAMAEPSDGWNHLLSGAIGESIGETTSMILIGASSNDRWVEVLFRLIAFMMDVSLDIFRYR